MKNLLFLVSALIFGISTSTSQIIFEEDFQGGSFSGFTLTDVDGLTPHWGASEFTMAWIVAPNELDTSDLTAQSTAWYNPVGTSDDWMSTPSISLGASGNLLSWDGQAYFPSSDGYEVWVNTSGPTPSDMLSGTLVFSILEEENLSTIRWANLDAFANQTVYIGFRNNTDDGHILLIDDIKVEVTPILDAEMVAITNTQYVPTASPSSINFEVKNTGLTPITEFVAEWTDGTNTYQQTFPTNITPLSVVSFTFTDQLTVNPGVEHPISANIVSVNAAGSDDNQANNTASSVLSGMTFIPEKLVVGEEATGTWCGWCPRGWDYMDYMFQNHPDNWIGIAIHNDDPLADAIYDAGMTSTISGYPEAHVDRVFLKIDPSQFESAYTDRLAQIPPAAITVNASQVGNNIELSVTAEFAQLFLNWLSSNDTVI
jgi:hypothetical protein